MKKFAVLICFVMVGCSNMQNDRTDYVVKKVGEQIVCPAPPADIVETLNKGGMGFSLKLNEVQKIALDSDLGIERRYQKIRDIDPQLQTIETVHYRLCVEYANGTFTKDEYRDIVSGLPYYGYGAKEKAASVNFTAPNLDLPKRATIASAGTWADESLGLSIKVTGVGGMCIAPCNLIIKASMEIKTSTYTMLNYQADKGSSIAFTHNNKTYKFTVEEIKTNPYYVVITVDEVKAE